ncbi:hypothetical protein KUTeg_002023 [Tegillarca granosa]|uniref:Uncharacterized protein n=1 Tax=Tegillarca granosa TaxID=220873 RepID=A0ABQ9FT49_TEGGR|nr:hypothetical protein KUTeg_002023 [Tegillarca granosa]
MESEWACNLLDLDKIKKKIVSPVNVLKDQNVSNKFSDLKQDSFSRSTGCDSKTTGEVSGIIKPPISKYVSSDSSFESVKAEKVERSASRDDGYSTMSSDIQPEAMEKYSDTSLNRNDSPLKKEVSNKVQEGGNKKESTSSDQDSAMDSSTQSTDLKHSSHSLSSQNSTSSEDKATSIYGSLGRVKAMKSLFEAEAHKGTEKLPVKFPLRKSPSYDSKFSVKDSDKSSDVSQNRRSLSADFKIFPTEIQSPVKEEIKLLPEPIKVVEQKPLTPFKADLINIEHEEIDTNYFVQDKSAIFNSLNLSEDNFLSDIPEEKDEWETSAHSSIRHLENVSSKFPQIPLFGSCLPYNLAALDPNMKKCLPSLYQFYRTLSDSDINRSSKKVRNICDFDLRKLSIDKPLERSVSMSELYKKRKISDFSFNLPPNLRRSFRQPLMNEEMVIGRAQDIVKSHILQQLSQFVESESDDEDDLDQFSFSNVLKRSKYNQQIEPHHKDNCDQLWNDKRTSLNLAIRRIYAGNIPQDKHSSNFDGFHGNLTSQDDTNGANIVTNIPDVEEDKNLDKGRQSSHESSPMPEGQTKFRSDYYSLCLVGSNRSLCSGSNEGESDMAELSAAQSNPNSAKHSYEFDMISRQIESLSKTVNDLHKSLSSLNSCDSDNESNEDHSQMFTSPSENFRDTHGYHWVEDDEFYLTPSGGEIILGSSPFSNTGAGCEFVNEYADDTSCNDEFEYYGNFSPDQPPFDVKKLYSNVKEGESVVLKSESKTVTESGKKDVSAIVKQKISKMKKENMFEVKSASCPPVSRTVDDNMVLDPEIRAAMLDSMVHLSGASMDSLDDNIGVDQVMCSRLLGRGDKEGVVKHASTPRPALDVSNLFCRYGDNEKEAVAAFDFLDDISTSPATSQTEISSTCQTEMDQSDQSNIDNVEQLTNQTLDDEAKTSVVESQGLDNSNITQPVDQNLNKNSANLKNLSTSDNKVNKGSNRTKNKERSKIPKAIKQDTNMAKSTRKSCEETSVLRSTRKSSTGSNSGNRPSSNS